MAKVSLQNLTKDFGKVRAVNNISVDIEDGEFIVVLGPSGAGKTTTLKLIAGVETPTSGRIVIGDRLVNAIEPHRRNVAMAFESYALYPHFTVKDNLSFPLLAPAHRLPADEVEKRVKNVAEILNIQMLLDRLPRMLSNGQKQRVALGRAMVREPEVLLLDEPISHLDAKLRHRMRTEFKALESVIRSTTIYVTHDYLEAMSLGDRLVVLNEGQIQQIGKPSDVFVNPANTFCAQILGHPQINLISGKVQSGGGQMQIVSDDGAICVDVPDALKQPLAKANLSSVIVGIRPQHLHALNGAASGTPTANVSTGKVYVYERLGTRGVLTATVGTHQVTILTPIEMDFTIDAPVQVGFDHTQLILFDTQTKNNVLFM
jgi:multiple sugar transport system ATP-binding protein